MGTEPASDRVRVRRGAHRADYDHDQVRAILDAGLVAHVGVTTVDGPIVLPMAYGHDGERLYLHGAAGNALLGGAVSTDVCVTVTVVDGLVVGRSPFHDSMNYRSVVVRGLAEEVVDPAARLAALRLITDHVAPHWDAGRPPSSRELRRTRVVSVPLAEVSAKVRTGGPGDEATDLGGPHWGGSVPLLQTWGVPTPADDLSPGVPVPAAVSALAGTVACASGVVGAHG